MTARERKEAGEGGASPADPPDKAASLRVARVAVLLLRGHRARAIRQAVGCGQDVVRGVRGRLRACGVDPYDVGAW